MELSLTKLPWYGQIGAFVVVCAGAVFGFWNFYVVGSADGHRAAADPSDGAARGHQQGRRDGAAAAGVPGAGHRARGEARKPPQRAARAEGRRRHAAPDSGAGDAVEPDDSALHAGAAEAAAALRRSAVPDFRRGHVSQPRAVLRSRQQVPADHQRRRHRDSRQRAAATRIRRSPPNAPRRRSCCRKRPREGGARRAAR